MVKRRSHTKRRKSRRGGAIRDYLPSWLGGTPAPTVGEAIVPAATPVLDQAATNTSPVVPPGAAAEPAGMNTLGGRRRRVRKTKRRGGKYY
jgi:hypothetical protein